MDRIIEQVNILKEEITNSKTGKQFESMRIGQFATSEILFADDTMIIAKDNESLKGLLWTVELVSGKYALKLNKGKCMEVINKQEDRRIHFEDGSELARRTQRAD